MDSESNLKGQRSWSYVERRIQEGLSVVLGPMCGVGVQEAEKICDSKLLLAWCFQESR
jgi:hypothetical protein